MKLGGYLITAETFKLKTVFKHPHKHHHVIFYARDADDKDNEVMLNNNNAIAVTPGGSIAHRDTRTERAPAPKNARAMPTTPSDFNSPRAL